MVNPGGDGGCANVTNVTDSVNNDDGLQKIANLGRVLWGCLLPCVEVVIGRGWASCIVIGVFTIKGWGWCALVGVPGNDGSVGPPTSPAAVTSTG